MILAAALMVSLHTAASSYTLTPIFTVEAGVSGRCIAINDDSQVLCATTATIFSTSDANRAFIWQDGKTTILPNPSTDPSEKVSLWPAAINNEGTVVGYAYGELGILGDTLGGFIWDAKRGIRLITVGGKSFEPTSIRDDGLIGGSLADGVIRNYNTGDRWGSTGSHLGTYLESTQTFTPIADLTQKGFLTVVAAIDPNGVAVANSMGRSAYRVKPGAEPESLSTPQYSFRDGSDVTLAQADNAVTSINKSGWMVGCMYEVRPGRVPWQEQIGAIWSPDNQYYLTGDALLNHINDYGVAVGTKRSDLASHQMPMGAMVWDRDHGLQSLQMLVPQGSPTLVEATSINNKGEIVALANDATWYLLRPAS